MASLSRGPVCLLSQLCLVLCCLIAGALGQEARAQAAYAGPTQTHTPATPALDDTHIIVLEVLLDGHLLSDSLTAYQDGHRFLLPLGELSRLLTLAITVNAQEGSAGGFVVKEDKMFGLHVGSALVHVNGREIYFDASLAQVIGDDIYVAHKVLQRWLMIDFEVDLPTLQLRIKPRINLPMQSRLLRERQGAPLGAIGLARGQDHGFALKDSPHAAIRAPFVDLTFGSDARFGRDSAQYRAAYAAYITSDLLGMEAAAYVSAAKGKTMPQMRLDLSRHDPDGQLLGPMKARTVELGHVVMPRVPNVLMMGQGGMGFVVDNHGLGQPSNFDRHSIRGDLSPGWEVTLYYNDALVGYQPAGANGRYAFDDLPLSFGPNEFRLVFNGPVGQVRVERQSFLIDKAIIKPGEFLYSLAGQQTDLGGLHIGQFDLGLTPAVSTHLGLVSRPAGRARTGTMFTQWGLRAYSHGVILNTAATTSPGGGLITDTALKTRVGRFALAFEYQQSNSRFVSDVYQPGLGKLRYRGKLGLMGSAQREEGAPVSLALEATRDMLASGLGNVGIGGRLSTLLLGFAVSNNLRWQRSAGRGSIDGSLQASRRVAAVGLNAQVDYAVWPYATVRTLVLTGDHSLSNGLRLNGGVLHSMVAGSTQLSAGLSKSFGVFELALSAGYSTRRELLLGLQFFTALGRDPRGGSWFADAQPMAGTGAVSVSVFVDKNLNGVREEGEEPVPSAGFLIGAGGRHPARTNKAGQAYIDRLTPGQYTDISLDASTLEDPQWKPAVKGVRILARPGLAQVIDLPVVYTAEVEGTVYLTDQAGRRRGIGDARIELLNEEGDVQASTRSSPDGYYLLHQVMPGRAVLRIAPDQAAKLGLKGTLSLALNVPADGEFLSGQDFELQRSPH
jgi:hypothetical protein